MISLNNHRNGFNYRNSNFSPRFIAVLDVLGFKERFNRYGLKDLVSLYSKFVDPVQEMMKWEVKATIFSDTILIYTGANMYNAPLEAYLGLAEVFTNYLSKLLSDALNETVPEIV